MPVSLKQKYKHDFVVWSELLFIFRNCNNNIVINQHQSEAFLVHVNIRVHKCMYVGYILSVSFCHQAGGKLSRNELFTATSTFEIRRMKRRLDR